jgi:hypothetical protein
MMRTHALLTVSLALLAGACSTTTPIGVEETAGSTGSPAPSGAAGTSAAAGTTGAAGLGQPGNYVPSPGVALNEQPFAAPDGVSGDWVGYFEDYQFGWPGSDAIKFHFGVDAQGHGTLTVKLGEGTVPPPPTSADDAWPVPFILPEGGPGAGLQYPDTPLDGFTYAAREVTWQGRRLKFHLSDAEPWTTWCALQTSYPMPGDDSYSCNGGSAARCNATICKFEDGTQGTTTPNHLYMCNLNRLCDCNATGCGAQTQGAAFDLTFFGDHASGTGHGHNVQLMPATP